MKKKKTSVIKKIMTVLLAGLLAICMALPVFADTITSDQKSEVWLNEGAELKSTFHDDVVDDTIKTYVEPGDTAVFTLDLRNDYKEAADFWMDRRTIDSLEVQGNDVDMKGGGYTYELSYQGPSGSRILYSSLNIEKSDFNANETPEMITKKIDNASYVFLDTFATGATGQIVLKVTLDGESQGNDYQDTLAKLAMDFAVELNGETTTTGGGSNVKTGDTSNTMPYFIIMTAAGLIILVVAIYIVVKRKKNREA